MNALQSPELCGKRLGAFAWQPEVKPGIFRAPLKCIELSNGFSILFRCWKDRVPYDEGSWPHKNALRRTLWISV
jgi:hypothetical protein